MDPRRLKAPAADGALLAAPPLPEAGTLLERNGRFLETWDHDFQGRRASWLRPRARNEVAARARSYLARFNLTAPEQVSTAHPLVVTGHQPELFHPGVWVKNFAVGGIAAESGGVGLNLIVDNDLPKSSSIRVPRLDPAGIQLSRIEFDEWGGEVPFEEMIVRDESRFAAFGERVRDSLGGAVADPLIESFWPIAVEKRRYSDRVGERFAAARRTIEADWGVKNLEIPLSAVCETESFLWFTSHLLAQLPRFQAVHNEALVRYRAAYGIRSRHHPVPALARRGEWSEAPFWIWRVQEPRRRPLMVRQLARTMELRIDGEHGPLMEIPLGPDREACCAVEQLLTLPAQGVRLRTRALTTTMFARLLLGDLFVHGIGGAKYDELGDEVIRRFFGIEPPRYLTLSMTLWLNLGTDPASVDRLHAVEHGLRDLTFNPDRHLGSSAASEAARWVEAKRAAIAAPVETHSQRVERFAELRRCNEAMQGWVEESRQRLLEERARVRSGLHRNALAHSREYAFVLHSESRLRAAMGQLGPVRAGRSDQF